MVTKVMHMWMMVMIFIDSITVMKESREAMQGKIGEDIDNDEETLDSAAVILSVVIEMSGSGIPVSADGITRTASTLD